MNINKDDIYLPDNPTFRDMNLSLEAIDLLDPKIMQHVAIESISSDPLYMAMGYIAANNSDGNLSKWKHVFEESLLSLQTDGCSLDPLNMANFILQQKHIYLDVSEQYWDRTFVFNCVNSTIEGIDYPLQIGTRIPILCRLELFMMDNIMYYNRNEWVTNAKTYQKIHNGCEHSFHDMSNTDSLYGFLMYHCSERVDFSRFQSFFKAINVDTDALGKFWLSNWLNTEIDLATHKLLNTESHDDLLISICDLIEADICVIKKHIEVIRSLNILSHANINSYTQLLYEAGKNKVFTVENYSPLDFDLIS